MDVNKFSLKNLIAEVSKQLNVTFSSDQKKFIKAFITELLQPQEESAAVNTVDVAEEQQPAVKEVEPATEAPEAPEPATEAPEEAAPPPPPQSSHEEVAPLPAAPSALADPAVAVVVEEVQAEKAAVEEGPDSFFAS